MTVTIIIWIIVSPLAGIAFGLLIRRAGKLQQGDRIMLELTHRWEELERAMSADHASVDDVSLSIVMGDLWVLVHEIAEAPAHTGQSLRAKAKVIESIVRFTDDRNPSAILALSLAHDVQSR